MIVSKERAEQIAELSYKIFEYDYKHRLITYKKAAELDNTTAERIINQLELTLKDIDMRTKVNGYGGKLYYADDEIVVVDNYQYIDYIERVVLTDSLGMKNEILSINCKIQDGGIFNISKFTQFYGPNVYYGVMFGISSTNKPLFNKLEEIELYLKLLIVEDRLVNLYKMYDMNHRYGITVVAMNESIGNYKAYDKEINLLNRLLKVCNGKIISSGELGGFADIGIKPTVLYLESIGENLLASELKRYQEDPLSLNLVLDMARKGYFGLTFKGRSTIVTLL